MIFINYNQPNLFEHRGNVSVQPPTPPVSKSFKNCNIVLENYDKAYQPGDEIVGKIECIYTEEEKPRGVYIELTGIAHDNVLSKQVKQYFYQKQVLFQNANNEVFTPGTYPYQFRYKLPAELPSNYKSETFEINYQIKAVIERVLLPESEELFYFNIISPIDLNNYPQLAVPYTDCDIQGYNYCCRERPIRMEVSVPKLAFAVGEKFRVTCFIHNTTPLVIEDMELKLIRRVEHIVCNPSRNIHFQEIELANCRRNIQEIRDVPFIFRKGEYTMVVEFEIPSGLMIPNFLDCSSIIRTLYMLHIEADVPWKEGNLRVRIPLTFGHIPYDESLHKIHYSSPSNFDEAEKLLINLVSLHPNSGI